MMSSIQQSNDPFPLELKNIEILIQTNIPNEEPFILTKSYLEFDKTPSASKKTKMSELPFFTINYEIPKQLIYNTYTSNKRITLFFRKRKLTDIILLYNHPIKPDDLNFGDKIRQNVMTMIECIFPTTYPIVNNLSDSLNSKILSNTKYNMKTHFTQTISKITNYFNNNKIFLNVKGNTYTPYRVVYLNDLINHPRYGEVIRNIGNSNKIKESTLKTLHDNIFSAKEKIFFSLKYIITPAKDEHNFQKEMTVVKTFLLSIVRQNLRDQRSGYYNLDYNYLEQLQKTVKIVTYLIGFINGVLAPQITYEYNKLFKTCEVIYKTDSSTTNTNNDIIEKLIEYIEYQFNNLTFLTNIITNRRICIRRIVFRNNLSFHEISTDSESDKIKQKITHLKQKHYIDDKHTTSECNTLLGVFNPSQSDDVIKDALYNQIKKYTTDVDVDNTVYEPLLEDMIQNGIFNEIPRTNTGVFFQLASLINDYKDLSILKNVKKVYFDRETVLIEDETNRFNQSVVQRYKREYDYTLDFDSKIKQFLNPNRESTNSLLLYLIERYASNDNNELMQYFEAIFDKYILKKPINNGIDNFDDYEQILDVGVSYYNRYSGTKPMFEICLHMDLFEGRLTKEIESKINCIFKNEMLGELYEYIVSKDKNQYLIENAKMFSIPKLLAYIQEDKAAAVIANAPDEIKQGGKKRQTRRRRGRRNKRNSRRIK